MTARDASRTFDLRCDVREAMLAFVRREMPEAIVRHRTVIERRGDLPARDGPGASCAEWLCPRLVTAAITCSLMDARFLPFPPPRPAGRELGPGKSIGRVSRRERVCQDAKLSVGAV